MDSMINTVNNSIELVDAETFGVILTIGIIIMILYVCCLLKNN